MVRTIAETVRRSRGARVLGGGVGSVYGAPAVVGASPEHGDTWLHRELWRPDDLRWPGSVFADFDTF